MRHPVPWGSEPEPTSGGAADAERDALALYQAAVTGRDHDSAAILLAATTHGSMTGIICSLINLLTEQLEAQGTDPEQWAAERQEQLRRSG